MPPLFDPEQGVTIIPPPGAGSGWWAGAPGGYFDSASGDFYLTYRLRRPRGMAPDRGAVCNLACSSDGVHFETIWSMEKTALDSPSLERSALHRGPDGAWTLYISYVDGQSSQWRTDRIFADDPRQFDLARRERLFIAADLGLAAVKDPVIVESGSGVRLFLSCAAARNTLADVDHHSADAYDTDTILSHTGLATAADGLHFEWNGLVLTAPDDGGWDGYSARIATVIPLGGLQDRRWLALYDGAYGVQNHYDETTGAAISADLTSWRRLTPEAPILAAPDGRCLRYVNAVACGSEYFVYYEYGLPDGSHELRLNRAPQSTIETFAAELERTALKVESPAA
ncbi:MAG TPA: hypothetical protein VFJ58_11830 [Armatimonadota bacterium]|nr:hypothetical protein [Armatimonadota bacterium]